MASIIPSFWSPDSSAKVLLSIKIETPIADLVDTILAQQSFQDDIHKIRHDTFVVYTNWSKSVLELPKEMYQTRSRDGLPGIQPPSIEKRFRKLRFTNKHSLLPRPFDSMEFQQLSEILEGKSYILDCIANTSAMYGDKFTMFIRYYITADTDSSCTLLIICKTLFTPSFNGFMAAIIKMSIEAGLKSAFRATQTVLSRKYPCREVSLSRPIADCDCLRDPEDVTLFLRADMQAEDLMRHLTRPNSDLVAPSAKAASLPHHEGTVEMLADTGASPNPSGASSRADDHTVVCDNGTAVPDDGQSANSAGVCLDEAVVPSTHSTPTTANYAPLLSKPSIPDAAVVRVSLSMPAESLVPGQSLVRLQLAIIHAQEPDHPIDAAVNLPQPGIQHSTTDNVSQLSSSCDHTQPAHLSPENIEDPSTRGSIAAAYTGADSQGQQGLECERISSNSDPPQLSSANSAVHTSDQGIVAAPTDPSLLEASYKSVVESAALASVQDLPARSVPTEHSSSATKLSPVVLQSAWQVGVAVLYILLIIAPVGLVMLLVRAVRMALGIQVEPVRGVPSTAAALLTSNIDSDSLTPEAMPASSSAVSMSQASGPPLLGASVGLSEPGCAAEAQAHVIQEHVDATDPLAAEALHVTASGSSSPESAPFCNAVAMPVCEASACDLPGTLSEMDLANLGSSRDAAQMPKNNAKVSVPGAPVSTEPASNPPDAVIEANVGDLDASLEAERMLEEAAEKPTEPLSDSPLPCEDCSPEQSEVLQEHIYPEAAVEQPSAADGVDVDLAAAEITDRACLPTSGLESANAADNGEEVSSSKAAVLTEPSIDASSPMPSTLDTPPPPTAAATLKTASAEPTEVELPQSVFYEAPGNLIAEHTTASAESRNSTVNADPCTLQASSLPLLEESNASGISKPNGEHPTNGKFPHLSSGKAGLRAVQSAAPLAGPGHSEGGAPPRKTKLMFISVAKEHLRQVHEAFKKVGPGVTQVANDTVAASGAFVGGLVEATSSVVAERGVHELDMLSRSFDAAKDIAINEVNNPIADGMKVFADGLVACFSRERRADMIRTSAGS